ncbi:SSU ribosomal protein S8p (S15Ae) [Dissulfuribacter thermophilus]|uniref:Small ribosomal subunit protein uS8 n=1 Tax=Dissulfuribacter thermophilus TaxID=1156395 RepID=A0A1B9F5M3_9BACT|nr:30S ribosomal protein S8 [Dissulfuribacter thermophilus]OCC15061.1 SSU ribosomal protein S8p (S15Ae) [Dissulfuribacter thermophilus]
MSLTDTIADMLTRIRNACMARHEKVDIPASKMKIGIAKLMKEHGYIQNYKLIKDGKQGILRITLRYHEGKPVILGLERISKPGRRQYRSSKDLPKIRNGFGMAVISTSKGLMTDEQARKAGVGGEVVCAIW